MAVRTRITRDSKQGDDFALPKGYGEDLDPDMALVGGGEDDNDALIDGGDGKDEKDWDDDGKDGKGKKPEVVEVDVDDDQDDGKDDEDDARLAYDLDHEGRDQERDNRREPSRRQRRNRSRREVVDRSAQEIGDLRQQLAAMQGVIQQVTGGQAHLAVNTIDGRLQAASQSLELADDLMAKAIAEGDGKAFALIQKQRDEAVSQIYALRGQKARIEASIRQNGGVDPRQQQRQEQAPPINQALAQRAEEMGNRFLDRNQWFDPEGTDRDSRMAKMIDQELAEEGYLPHTSAFWIQFETRCKEAGLGTATRRRPQEQDDGGEDERQERQRPAPARREANMPPTGVVRSTRGPGKGTFTLSQVQVGILEEEGLMESKLSEADQAKKNRIITRWKEGAKQSRAAR